MKAAFTFTILRDVTVLEASPTNICSSGIDRWLWLSLRFRQFRRHLQRLRNHDAKKRKFVSQASLWHRRIYFCVHNDSGHVYVWDYFGFTPFILPRCLYQLSFAHDHWVFLAVQPFGQLHRLMVDWYKHTFYRPTISDQGEYFDMIFLWKRITRISNFSQQNSRWKFCASCESVTPPRSWHW